MALWDSLTKKASETTAKAVQQAKILAETSRLNGLISDEERKRDNAYREIGKLYVQLHADDFEESFADLIAVTSAAERNIADYRAQIQDVKGVMRCGNCGAEVAKGVAFCSACGAAMPRVEPVETDGGEKCTYCGAQLQKGAKFCTSCGTPVAAAPELPKTETAPSEQPEQEPVSAEVVEQPQQEEAPESACEPVAEQPQAVEERICASCGAKLEADDVFCTQCGAKN